MNPQDYLKRPVKPSSEPSRPGSGGRRSFSAPVLVVFVVVFGLAALYFYARSSAAATQLAQVKAELAEVRQNPGKAAKAETQALLERVGQLIVLPPGEEPTVATVNDPERLKVQPFFLNAKQGDKVLIFTNAKKAILYDPVNNKIVEVAPVAFGNPPPPTTP